ncbi:MAG: hypothetical protein JW987_10055 [Anaerolineaceae bacterium]|nr:hypothetical protein [Anaerolineaceae bacterium]
MASWIVHLRITENLLTRIPGLDEQLFSIGNIAPDSGIPDEKWENFTPPPEVTHFITPEAKGTLYHHNDLLFYREHLLPLRGLAPDALSFSFLLGYFFHLITDNCWSIDIGRPTRKRFAEQFAADKDFIWEVKKDWYGLDHRFVREHSESLFWRVFLHCGYSRADLPFLPAEAVQQRIAYIQEYYQSDSERVREMLDRPYVYLSAVEMDAFVSRTADHLLQIYTRLWVEGASFDGHVSALEIL